MLILRILAVLLLVCSAANATTGRQPSTVPPAPASLTKYYCPMRCEGEKTYEQPGRCPVCKMKLKPVADAPAPLRLSLELDTPKLSDILPLKAADAMLKLVAGDKSADLKPLMG